MKGIGSGAGSGVTTVTIVGGSGYIGGELLRLLLGHPGVRIAAVTSNRLRGKRVDGAHPNLRGRTDLTFAAVDAIGPSDVLMLATPHTATMSMMTGLAATAKLVVDLSADFRLRDPSAYQAHYGVAHTAADLIPTFTPGLPELYRQELRTADRISVPGCMANAAILALHPLTSRGLVTGDITVDARTGSSGSGTDPGPANAHAERSGAMRVFAPVGHRHEAEISQATGHPVRMSATGVEAVRGVQVLCRVALADGVDTASVRTAYRQAYASEPFVRIVAQTRGTHRLPDPKILAGSNYCDVGAVVDEPRRQVAVIGALDNLVKGGAGNAVQCLNLRLGWPEPTGLEFPGLHPA